MGNLKGDLIITSFSFSSSFRILFILGLSWLFEFVATSQLLSPDPHWYNQNLRRMEDLVTIEWDSIIQISANTFQSSAPQVFSIDDKIHIFWYTDKERGPGAQYARSENGGISFSQAVTLIDPTVSGHTVTPELFAFAATGIYAYVTATSFIQDSNLVTTSYASLLRSASAGATWDTLNWIFHCPTSCFTGAVVAKENLIYLVMDIPSQSDSSPYRLLCSTDHGDSWISLVEIPSSDSPLDITPNSYGLHYFGNQPSNSPYEIMYERTSDLGSSWSSRILLSSDDGYVSDEARATSTDDGYVYAVWRDDKYSHTCDGYFASVLLRRSTNNGESWEAERVMTERPTGNAPCIAAEGSSVAVAWDDCNDTLPVHSVMRLSSDHGQTWGEIVPINPAGGNIQLAIHDSLIHAVWNLEPDSSNQYHIYYRRGRTSSVTSVPNDDTPPHFSVSQNYPNPFNPSTSIQFTVPRAGPLSIIIYDILGREVSRLLNRQIDPGAHTISWNASAIPGGVYFYRLHAGNYTETKKLLLLK